MNLGEKTVLVTGASSGLGRAISLSFAKECVRKLILTGRNQERLNQITQDCKQSCENTVYFVADMTKDDDIAKLASFVEAEVESHLDIFVSNHGYPGTELSVVPEFDPLKNFDLVMKTNFMSHVQLTNLVARFMGQGGAIVYITSINSTLAEGGGSAYCCSKASLAMFMKCAAIDLSKKGIRVNAVAPGMLDTPFQAISFETPEKQIEGLTAIGSKLPLRRIPTVQGIANTVLFLSSDLACDITGYEQVVDCGHLLMCGSLE